MADQLKVSFHKTKVFLMGGNGSDTEMKYCSFSGGCVTLSPPGLHRRGTHLPSSQVAMAWLDNFAHKYADKMPDREKLHLPSCLSRRDVYTMCQVELEQVGVAPCSKSHFYYLWRKKFPNIAIPKVSG